MNITKQNFLAVVNESVSKSEVCRKLGIHANGAGLRKVGSLATEFGISISHFSQKAAIDKFNRKYKLIEKQCPVCQGTFQTQDGHKREKATCSHACANTYFRSGQNNPNYNADEGKWGYRRICFSKWEKKCVICGFDKVVDVHHFDYNKKNNDVNNLIPLCPNHHMMLHTKQYNEEVVSEIVRVTGLPALK